MYVTAEPTTNSSSALSLLGCARMPRESIVDARGRFAEPGLRGRCVLRWRGSADGAQELVELKAVDRLRGLLGAVARERSTGSVMDERLSILARLRTVCLESEAIAKHLHAPRHNEPQDG